jgi:hypothetical protein
MILENGCAGNRYMKLLCLYILFDVDLDVQLRDDELIKRYQQPKGQSRMNNPETLTMLGA